MGREFKNILEGIGKTPGRISGIEQILSFEVDFLDYF
jgi:hypothetical protein